LGFGAPDEAVDGLDDGLVDDSTNGGSVCRCDVAAAACLFGGSGFDFGCATDFGCDFVADFGTDFGTDFGCDFGCATDFGCDFGTDFGCDFVADFGCDFGTDFGCDFVADFAFNFAVEKCYSYNPRFFHHSSV
jgi:hypothetical protein